MVKIKICGITNFEDAITAVKLGADFIGFVFAPSPRRITPETARAIISQLSDEVVTVGVFTAESAGQVKGIADYCRLGWLQFHGDEPPDYCRLFSQKVIKAVRVRDRDSLKSLTDYKVDAFLLDTYREDKFGGTGEVFDWKIALEAKRYGQIFLSGGLDPENVAEAIKMARPYGVDVSSGIESKPGKKDIDKMRAFIEACQKDE